MHQSDEPQIRIGPLAGVPVILTELGVDPAKVLCEFGLEPDLLAHPDVRIPYSLMGKLLAHCARTTQCEHFGLLVGQLININALGAMGFLMQSANNLKESIQAYIHLANWQDQGAETRLFSDNGFSILSYTISIDDIEGANQIYDGTMAGHQNLLMALCGPGWKPLEILLSRSRPKNTKPYDRIFKAPVRYNAEQNGVMMQSRSLQLIPRHADPELHLHLQKEMMKQEPGRPVSVAAKVRYMVRELLGGHACTLSEIASCLGMHARTLNRRLQVEGTTFQAEVDAVRYQMARHFLNGSEKSISEIASIIGYASNSAFTHAFRRWSDVTPGEWRDQQRA